MTKFRRFYFIVCLLVACQTTNDVPTTTPILPTATTIIAQVTPTTTSTTTPLPSATATASHTPTPTKTATPTPTPTIPANPLIEAPNASLPAGFSITQFATLPHPTSLTFDPAGNLYATSADGTIHIFTNPNQDGYADTDHLFSGGFNTPLGIAIHPTTGDVYVSSQSKISILRDLDGNFKANSTTTFVNNLPVGLHLNNNLKFGPDGLLYIGVGSTCDVCLETDPRSATIMRFNTETGDSEVFASGMRNPFDLAFHPLTNALFATDNGRDDLGLDAPSEELNHIIQNAHYGWPACWDDLQGTGCAGTTPAITFFPAHVSANSLAFYTGDTFPAGYTHTLFVAIFGSWLKPSVETGIMQVHLTPAGDTYTTTTEWFAQWDTAMPLGLTIGPDGALYVGDYTNNLIYRISYGN